MRVAPSLAGPPLDCMARGGPFLDDGITTNLRREIAQIAVPVTVLFPYDDAGAPTRLQAEPVYRANYAALPATRFVGIAGAAHFLMLDQPDNTLDSLRRVLEERPPRCSAQ